MLNGKKRNSKRNLQVLLLKEKILINKIKKDTKMPPSRMMSIIPRFSTRHF